MKKFMIRFRGVRGSFPVPGVDTLKIGGNTSCVEFRIGNAIVIIDAGTGIISLGEDLLKEHFSTGKPVVATLLFSHMHHDHNQGFSFFKPAYLGSSILYMFGPTMFEKSMEEMLSQVMRPPFSPVRLEDLNSQRFIYNLRGPEEILIDPETGKAFIATSKQGYGHSSPEMAVEVARKANARQLVLYHHDPSHNDKKIKEKEKDIQKLFPNTIAAYEGLVIHLIAQEAA